VAVVALLIAPSGLSLKAQSTSAELPRVLVDTTYAPPGPIVNVASGGNLQTAINNASLGTTIMVQAGANYGAVNLPNKSGSGWIYIMSNGVLPAPGVRVTPTIASQLARIQVSSSSAVSTAGGAHHYRFVGIEFSVTGTLQSAVVDLDGGSNQPHHIILDRCYVHGTTSGTHRRGVTMHGNHLAVIDSWVSDFHEGGADSQAIVAWSGTGPLKIVNNRLEGAGENVMIGGASPSVQSWVPSDIEIRSNYFFKPTSWRSSSWSIKNLLEFKQGRRVLVEGNVFENNWASGQSGFAFLITPRSEDGGAVGATQDITVRRNKFVNIAQGINISGEDDTGPSERTARVVIQDNLIMVQCTGCSGGQSADGRAFQFIHGPSNVTISHNTVPVAGTMAMSENSPKSAGFVFKDNIVVSGNYGFTGTGTGSGTSTLNTYYTSPVFTANAVIGGSSGSYPSGNYFPSSTGAVGFASMGTGDYALGASSTYRGVGSDGKDLGADMTAMLAATVCAVSGVCNGAPPPPPPTGDTTPPTVSMTSPAAGATVAGQIVVAANAADNIGVVGVQFQINGTNFGSEMSGGPYSASWSTSAGPDGSYSLTAIARDAAGNKTTSTAVTVTVKNTVTPPPPTAPVISGVSASGITSSSATVNWTTNQAATSQVEYGTTTAYGSATTFDSALVTAHNTPLSGLTAGTTYHYRVKSQNAQGQLAVSPNVTLTTTSATLPVFKISNVSSSRINSRTMKIAWTTSIPASSQVEYGTTTAYGKKTTIDWNMVTSHWVQLSNLTTGTTYYFRVKSKDADGRTRTSGQFTFTTTTPQWQ